jgi:hypothetical protein
MYRIISVDGAEQAEQLLNDTVNANTELVHSSVHTVQQEPAGEQENVLLGVGTTRFTFIFRTLA